MGIDASIVDGGVKTFDGGVKIGSMMSIYGCDHNQMSQQWQRTQGLQSFLWSFSFYHKNDFWDEIFCNMLLKILFFF